MKAILRNLATLVTIAIAYAAVASGQTQILISTGGVRSERPVARAAGITPETSAAINAHTAKTNLIAQKIREGSGGMSDADYTNLSLALLGASEAGLEAASSAQSYRTAITAIRSADQTAAQRVRPRPVRDAGIESEALGDTTSEFVFYPIVPCRLLDTREGGPRLTALSPWSVWFDGGNYGGQAACTRSGVQAQLGGTIAGLERAALVINLTATGATVNGWIQARPVGSTAFTSNQNFYPGQNIANMVVVQNSGASSADFELVASQPVHAIVDVLGVYAPPMAAALDCVDVRQQFGASGDLQNGEGCAMLFGEASCAAGYSTTSIRCEYVGMPYPTGIIHATTIGYACFWRNETGAGIPITNFYMNRRCCRIPGR